MKVSVTTGKSYAVSTPEECTVTSADGTIITQCLAGEQTVFIAPCTEIEISSDKATVTASFKSASAGGNSSRGYAQQAIEAAEEAQQALAAIPQMDASGSMTVSGGLTVAGAINANGGLVKPIAVLPTTAESVMNRNDTFGSYCVMQACSLPSPIESATVSSAGGISASEVIKGQIWKVGSSSAGHRSASFARNHELSAIGNYGGIAGYTIPISPIVHFNDRWLKITLRHAPIGYSVIETQDADTDMWRISPKYTATPSIYLYKQLAIIDVTFYKTNSDNTGYRIRVREMRFNKDDNKWYVTETNNTVSNFNGAVNAIHNLTYHQQYAPYDSKGKAGLWVTVNGHEGNRVQRIAELTPIMDLFNNHLSYFPVYVDLYNYAGLYIGNTINFIPPGSFQKSGAVDAFEAVEYKNVESQSTYEFVPYDTPTEEEDEEEETETEE